MPKPVTLVPLTGPQLLKALGQPKKISADYPKKALTAAELKAAHRNWQETKVVATVAEEKERKITAVKLRETHVARLGAIIKSSSPTAEAIAGQKMGPDEILGTLYSSFGALGFADMKSEMKSRLAKAKTPAEKKAVQAQWANVVSAGQQAYAAAGLKVSEADLNSMAAALAANKTHFNSFMGVANTAKAEKGIAALALDNKFKATGAFLVEVGKLVDLKPIETVIGDLCSKPFAEGKFTKHFDKDFSLKITITVWCPTWTNPFRTCKKTITLAGLSFSIGVEVGYRVTCCGATAWGNAHAEVCATVIGIKVCAGCSATITGVAGIGRSGSGNNCTYGIGINAQLTCQFAGVTIFNVQAPFGFNVSGPCPPVGHCK